MANRNDLKNWKNAKQTLVRSSRDPHIKQLLEASENGEFVEITYYGGSTPGETRSIMPIRLFTVKGYGKSVYIEAFCEQRQENRVFHMDRLEIADEDLSSTRLPTSDRARSKVKRAKTPKNKVARSSQTGLTKRSSTNQRSKSIKQPMPDTTSGESSRGWLLWLAIGALLLFTML